MKDAEEIKARLDIVDVIGDTVRLKRSGKGYVGLCPFHEEKTPSFHVSPDKQLFHCFGCGRGGDVFTYVMEKEGYSFPEALKHLADRAGIDLTEKDIQEAQAKRTKQDMLEALQERFIHLLSQPEGEEAREYLYGRGYSDEDIDGMKLGYFPGYADTIRWLEENGYDKNARAGALDYLENRNDYRITFLWRDQYGRPLSLWGRLIREAKEGEGKYMPFGSGGKGVPLNLHNARGLDDITLVEGFFDALLAESRGVRGVVALGGTSITSKQLDVLTSKRFRSITLALDNDVNESGAQGMEKAIPLLQEKGFRVYVAELPENIKDPDELMAKQGPQAFEAVIADAKPGATWLVERLIKQHDLGASKSREAAFEKIMAYVSTLPPFEQEDATRDLAFTFGITKETMAEELRLSRQKKAREDFKAQARKELEALALEARENPEKALEAAEDVLARLRMDGREAVGIGLPEPYTFTDLLKDLENTREGISTGYRELDKYVSVPQGAITIVAGRPGHGKTTFLLNLALNMARKYPEKRVYFFSYEESEKWLALKLTMMMAGYVFSKEKNLAAYVEYLRGMNPGGRNPGVDEAREDIEELLESGRLTLIYKNAPADELADMIKAYGRRGDTGAVFVDYIQKVPAPEGAKFSAAYQKVQLASELLRDAAVVADIPLIMGAQFRRPQGASGGTDKKTVLRLENLRESGDIEQDANLVLGLYNQTAANLEDEPIDQYTERITKEYLDLDVGILKNRGGTVGKFISLGFRPAVWQITDK